MDREARLATRRAEKRPRVDDDEDDAVVVQAPWPRPKRTPFELNPQVFNKTPREMLKSEAFAQRERSDQWDDFDSMYYNSFCSVKIEPTKILCLNTLKAMGIRKQMIKIMKDLGLGTMGTKYYPLYPEYTRQFLASCELEFDDWYNKTAGTGALSFKVNGVKYRISFEKICEVFGFDRSKQGVTLPASFPGTTTFWPSIGIANFRTNQSTITDIRHPVLRLLAKVISHTLLCTQETSKMRINHLILLYYAVGDKWPELQASFSHDHDINFGAVFANHLVSIKSQKGLTGTGTESVGSLLTPLFKEAGVDMSYDAPKRTPNLIDERYLVLGKFIRDISPDADHKKLLYHFNAMHQPRDLKLPSPYTSIDTKEDLMFQVDPTHYYHSADVRYHRAGSSTRAAVEAAEETPAAAASSSEPPTDLLGPFPHPPEGTYEDTVAFRRYSVSVWEKMWNFLRCTRTADTIRPPPTRRSPTPESD